MDNIPSDRWLVKKSNFDTERFQLNRILQSIAAATSGGGAVASVGAGAGIDVDVTDPLNPIVSHEDTSSVANLSSDNTGVVVLQDITFTFDAFGHVTACSVGTVNLATSFEPIITAGTTAQIWRGDKVFTSTILGDLVVGSSTGITVGHGLSADITCTALGRRALSTARTGGNCTAVGLDAMRLSTAGAGCTAVGQAALRVNTGANNTAVGTTALTANTSGGGNAAVGQAALGSNTIGASNMAFGNNALTTNVDGSNNSGIGVGALRFNVSGDNNIALGTNAARDTTGDENVAIGVLAGLTATAANANTTGSSNTWVGYSSGPGTPAQLSNSSVFGAQALVTTSNTVVLGRAASDFTVIGATGNSGGGCKLQVTGHVGVLGAGNGLRVAEGANAKQGVATLVAGTVVVANTSVTANSRIFLTHQNNSGTVGFVTVSARTAGTSFTILSSSATDTSTIAYQIFEPGT